MTVLLDPSDVTARLTPAIAIEGVRDALRAAARGELAAPARTVVGVGDGALVFTIGAAPYGYGFRVYDRFGSTSVDDQLVALWSRDGRLTAVAHGPELGRRRTGAIGAIAIDALRPPGPLTVGIVGAGQQAWHQIWALRALRQIHEVRIFRRNAAARAEWLERFRRLVDHVAEAETAEDAAVEVDVVILATPSTQPVVDPSAVPKDALVSSLGPKDIGASELPALLVDRARMIVTDAPAQLGPSSVATDRALTPLWSLIEDPPRRREGSVFLSAGLGGTEVAVLARALDARAG
ncbi:ornithine cyclodeaminase/mu-crystallin [Acidimicrobium ferrooxidans DSM 10331]|uniref:Ornithine cyclodeaminase/mu-crystallin n=1 Tax=Acidimicrobium ferrooxidans (strain DSM 10331 / JCM 15462 / NBRC 103882 / ICP) TaxID=525909 RepID=C7M187_ACIFD|nr:NAD(P)-binding domain-containing protein [Acidimicrobium ferrooxidans]ACU54735.1 ornithine cyclodeaminase/mu-crystallin [Acidimicrobium ferrooxidans DSM 10331]